MVQPVRSVRSTRMPGSSTMPGGRRPCAASGGTAGRHQIATLETIRRWIAFECFNVLCSHRELLHRICHTGQWLYQYQLEAFRIPDRQEWNVSNLVKKLVRRGQASRSDSGGSEHPVLSSSSGRGPAHKASRLAAVHDLRSGRAGKSGRCRFAWNSPRGGSRECR